MEKDKVYIDYEVTLYPKPFTTVVFTEYPWEAVRTAEENYNSAPRWEFGFSDYKIRAMTKEEAREKYEQSLKK